MTTAVSGYFGLSTYCVKSGDRASITMHLSGQETFLYNRVILSPVVQSQCSRCRAADRETQIE